MPVDNFHVESKKVKSQLYQLNPKASVALIYLRVELPDNLTSNFRSEYCKFVLFIGRLVVRKNLKVVILAFRDVIKALPEAKLIVAGERPTPEEWQDLVKNIGIGDGTIFLGHIAENIKMDLIAKCSAVVFPSLEEGFGLVATEAFAMRKPVLISDLPPFDEIVDDGVDGFLLPPHDPAKMVREDNLHLKKSYSP